MEHTRTSLFVTTTDPERFKAEWSNSGLDFDEEWISKNCEFHTPAGRLVPWEIFEDGDLVVDGETLELIGCTIEPIWNE